MRLFRIYRGFGGIIIPAFMVAHNGTRMSKKALSFQRIFSAYGRMAIHCACGPQGFAFRRQA